jgi:hypothetical protein
MMKSMTPKTTVHARSRKRYGDMLPKFRGDGTGTFTVCLKPGTMMSLFLILDSLPLFFLLVNKPYGVQEASMAGSGGRLFRLSIVQHACGSPCSPLRSPSSIFGTHPLGTSLVDY